VGKQHLAVELDKAALAAAVEQRDTADRERQHASNEDTLNATIIDKERHCEELTLRVKELESSLVATLEKSDELRQELYIAEDLEDRRSAEVLRLSSSVADQADTLQGLKDMLAEAKASLARSLPKADHRAAMVDLERSEEECLRRKDDQHAADLARLTSENMALHQALTAQVCMQTSYSLPPLRLKHAHPYRRGVRGRSHIASQHNTNNLIAPSLPRCHPIKSKLLCLKGALSVNGISWGRNVGEWKLCWRRSS
jgi:uncharacterized coiled-coil protein SlyX